MTTQRSVFTLMLSASALATLLLGANLAGAAEHNSWPATKVGEPAPKIEGLPPELARNLANFDDLDFHVYTGQQWQDLHKSHTQDVLVHYPDGHTTKGLQKHIDELKYLWTFAPDNRITEHTVRFGTADAEWTAVMGWLDGTFTRPMFLADHTVIAPTGKPYHLPMATIGHWNKQGIMFEEYLFWDNAAFMKQVGLGK